MLGTYTQGVSQGAGDGHAGSGTSFVDKQRQGAEIHSAIYKQWKRDREQATIQQQHLPGDP